MEAAPARLPEAIAPALAVPLPQRLPLPLDAWRRLNPSRRAPPPLPFNRLPFNKSPFNKRPSSRPLFSARSRHPAPRITSAPSTLLPARPVNEHVFTPRESSLSAKSSPASLEVGSEPPAARFGPPSFPPPKDADLTAFRAILDGVRRKRPALASVFEHAAMLELTPERIVLAYEATSFLVQQATDASSVEALTLAASDHFGRPIEVRVEIAAGRPQATTLAQIDSGERKTKLDAARRAVADHPLVTAAMELLGAELRDVKLASELAD